VGGGGEGGNGGVGGGGGEDGGGRADGGSDKRDIHGFLATKTRCHIINHIYLFSMFVSNLGSRTTVYSNSRIGHIRPLIWIFFICMEGMGMTQIGLR
jgi:hypothetical protein